MTETPNPIQMQKFLGGVDYPAERDELVAHAQSKGADDAVVAQLKSMPDRSYDGPNAVSKAFASGD